MEKDVFFLNDFVHLASISGNYYDANVCNKFFTKLPGELGREIELKWKQEQPGVDDQWNNATVRAKVIIDHLKAKCSMIQTQRELKKKDTGFCSSIYTPQTYDKTHKKKKVFSNKRKPKKTYFLRKSNARKPTLNKERHVRKYKDNKNYSKFSCYACGKEGHLSSKCSGKKTLFNQRVDLINYTNEDLVDITSDVSTNSDIYSIISIEGMQDIQQQSDYSFVEQLAPSQTPLQQKYGYHSSLVNLGISDEEAEMFQTVNFVNIEVLECPHKWKFNTGNTNTKCYNCLWYPSLEKRSRCDLCRIEVYYSCLSSVYNYVLPELLFIIMFFQNLMFINKRQID